jgi:hypothetical protein
LNEIGLRVSARRPASMQIEGNEQMIGLTKADWAELQTLLANGQDANEACEAALTEFNDCVAVAWKKLAEAIAAANAAAAAVAQWVGEHVADWEIEVQDRSERWQRSEAGEEVQELIGEWGDFAATLDEEITADAPEEVQLEFPDYDATPMADYTEQAR